jgi:hypothetical protein
MKSDPLVPAGFLLVGTGVLAVAGAFHPLPAGDAAERLRTIAATAHWTLVHWSLLGAQLLVLSGYMSLAAWLDGTGQQVYLRPGAAVIIVGVVLVSLNILFMTGVGPSLAAMQERGAAEAGLAASLFDALHPWGLASQRLGGVALGGGLALYGVAIARSGVLPRMLGQAGATVGALWVVTAAISGAESAPFLAAYGLAGGWQVWMGGALLKARRRNGLSAT